MAGENFQAQDDFGQVQRVKQFTTTVGVITYSAKTGRAADDFVIDRVIRVTTTADYDLTINLPNGVYYGQQCLVIFEVDGSDETIDVTSTLGDSSTQITAVGGWTIMQWGGDTIGWLELNAYAGE